MMELLDHCFLKVPAKALGGDAFYLKLLIRSQKTSKSLVYCPVCG